MAEIVAAYVWSAGWILLAVIITALAGMIIGHLAKILVIRAIEAGRDIKDAITPAKEPAPQPAPAKSAPSADIIRFPKEARTMDARDQKAWAAISNGK